MEKIGFKKIAVKTWHLLFKGKVPELELNYSIEHWENPPVDEYLQLYIQVGKQWGWTSRLLLSSEELQMKLADSTNEVWLFKQNDTISGFFEIDRSESGKAEIVYFGLLPNMIGKGLGKSFLNAAIATAAGNSNCQVWLHTCEYDHPNALDMYIKAGFIIEYETIDREYYPVDFNPNIVEPHK